MIYKNRASLELKNLRKMVNKELMERKERSDKRVRDQMNLATSTSDCVKKRKIDSSSITNVKIHKKKEKTAVGTVLNKIKQPIVESSSSKNAMVPIKSILSKTQEKSPFDVPSPDSKLAEGKSKEHKMIPLKFYSSKEKRKLSSEDASDICSSIVGDNKKSTSKHTKRDMSFEAALCKGGSNRKKLVKNKELISRIKEKKRLGSLNMKANSDTQGTEEDQPLKGTPSPITEDATMINLSQLRNSTAPQSNNRKIRKVERVIDKQPPVPRPRPTFSILTKKEIEFNGRYIYRVSL